MFGLFGTKTAGKSKAIDWRNVLSATGGALQDLDGSFGTGNLDRVQAQIKAAKDARSRKQLLAQATQGANLTPQQMAQFQLNPKAAAGNMFTNSLKAKQQAAQQAQLVQQADQYGLQGKERLAFLSNSGEYGKNLSTNYGAANVSAGDTRYFGNGQSPFTAAKTVNNGNQFFTIDGLGVNQSGDFGPTRDEQNDFNKNSITQQNNLATQGIRRQEANAGDLQAQAAMLRAQTPQNGLSLTTDPLTGAISFNQGGTAPVQQGNGQPPAFAAPFGGNKQLAQAFAKKDADLFSSQLEASNGSATMLTKLDEVENILSRYDTNALAGVSGNAARVQSALGLGGEQKAADFEQLNSLSRELGADALKLFGGSDTEKELQVAIETNPRPEYTPDANRRIVERKRKAIQVLSSQADFTSEWLQRNGSTAAKDRQSGKSYGAAWKQHQKATFGDSSDNDNGWQNVGGVKIRVKQ